jgi:hypothetical protein
MKRLIAALGLILLTQTAVASADVLTTGVPVLTAMPSMGGVIDDSWSKAVKLPVLFDFTYQRPGEPTDAYVAQDPSGLDVAFAVTQHATLTASQQTNGPGVSSDDRVAVTLWPQGNNGFRYRFVANALGARYQSSSENSAYEPTWTAAARRTADGYTVTMHIPWNIMRSGGSKSWSAQFERLTVADNGDQVWEYVQGQRNSADSAYAGLLTGLNVTAQAKAVRPQPRLQVYGLGEMAPSRFGGNTSRIGADLAIPITATSSLLGAFHPDYSNVETDQQSISPTAFHRFLNEVRPFFTQAAQNFNNTFSCTNCPTTLYTPAIPTFRQGYAYEGTAGKFSFGAFDAVGFSRTDSAEVLNWGINDTKQIVGLSLQRVSVNVPGFRDNTTTLYTGYLNQHTHDFVYLNAGSDSGTAVTDNGFAQYWEYGGGYVDKTTTIGFTFQKVGPQFNPVDGFLNQPDVSGYQIFANKTFVFSKTATLQDIRVSEFYAHMHDHSGNPAQLGLFQQVNFDLKNQLSIHVFGGVNQIEIFNGEFLPFYGNGGALIYRGQTSTPTVIVYQGGPYYHGHLTSWTYSTVLPIMKHLHLALEDDENFYASPTEPTAKQWLERASLDWQFSRDASFDIGARRIIGRNLPDAFEPPQFAFLNAGNISAAFHFLAAKNEFYLVYGSPNSLATTPALIFKWIRYIGAEKGT